MADDKDFCKRQDKSGPTVASRAEYIDTLQEFLATTTSNVTTANFHAAQLLLRCRTIWAQLCPEERRGLPPPPLHRMK